MNYHIDKSFIEKFYDGLDYLINNDVFKGRDLIVFGTSSSVDILMSYLEHKNVIVNAIIDNNKEKQGKKYYNVDIYSPESILTPFRDNALILIISTIHYKEMINQLQGFGYDKKHIYQLVDFDQLNNETLNDKEYIELNDNQCKKVMLDILKDFDIVCQEHKLKYWLGYGTLLGAVRHKGFIPWDDDIDVIMPINDYNKLISLMEDNKVYSMITPENTNDYPYEFSRLIKNDNDIIMKINTFAHKSTSGVFIEIFPLVGLPKDLNEEKKYIQEFKTAITNKWGSIYSIDKFKENKKVISNIMQQYDFENSNKVSNLSIYFEKEIILKDVFDETVYIEFEDGIFPVPKGYHQYLSYIYGDYMQFPPEKDRKNKHNMRIYKRISSQ